MMIMFDFNKKKEFNFHKLTEFSCMSLTLDSIPGIRELSLCAL